jgi:Electron transfer DM13
MDLSHPRRPGEHGFPRWLRLTLAPIVAAIVLLGIWISGGRITDDFRVAMVLTGLWFGVAGLAALVIAWRWRPLGLPVLGAYIVTALAAGGYLAYASMVDKVVDEDVAIAAASLPLDGFGTNAPGEKNVALARGTFTSGEHETRGTATVIRLAGGNHVLTLTDFSTSPGPDLRVYLVTGGPEELGDVVDLGGLKGNKGNQQYEIPVAAELEGHRTVVVWCRAFSVAFGSAPLA